MPHPRLYLVRRCLWASRIAAYGSLVLLFASLHRGVPTSVGITITVVSVILFWWSLIMERIRDAVVRFGNRSEHGSTSILNYFYDSASISDLIAYKVAQKLGL